MVLFKQHLAGYSLFRWILMIVLWVPIIILSLLLAHNAILYFTHGGEYGILPEKIIAQKDWLWNLSFYIHLPTGIICLLLPLISFSYSFSKKRLPLHRQIGKIYVWITLLLVCPTGMYLALYAKGGLITQIGFLLQGILLMIFTLNGYQAGIRGDRKNHIRYMMHSYAAVLVVISFRVFHILFFFWKVPYEINYAISQWLGIFLNALLAEILFHYINSFSKNKLTYK